MKVLVAGGAGYIGSTVCSALKDAGYTPIVLDSLVRGKEEFAKQNIFYQGDIANLEVLQKIIAEQGKIEYVIDFAAFISVPESTEKVYEYYNNNITKTIEFLNNLNKVGCKNVIFSSSASVYGSSDTIEVTEENLLRPSSPYARTKAIMEGIIEDFCNCYGMKGIMLRYFNPLGADPELRTGAFIENPSHVLGKLLEAYRSKERKFTVTGVDWDTRDGSGIRDYIHIWDLAKAHVKALEKLPEIFEKKKDVNSIAINVGRGEGITVKELVKDFEEVVGEKLNVSEGPARPGDVAGAFANCDLSKTLLNWKAELTVKEAMKDAIRWDRKKEEIGM